MGSFMSLLREEENIVCVKSYKYCISASVSSFHLSSRLNNSMLLKRSLLSLDKEKLLGNVESLN